MTANIVQHFLFMLGISFLFIVATNTSLLAQQEAATTADNLILQSDNCTTGTYHYQANDFIQATNQIGTTAKAAYEAGNFIQLKSGFQAQKGSDFRAYIEKSNHPEQNETTNAVQLTATNTDYSINAIGLKNYPNPFQQATTIEYELPEAAKVSLRIYNIMGQLQQVLLENDNRGTGMHRVTFDRQDLDAGTYLYQLTVNDKTITKKLMIH